MRSARVSEHCVQSARNFNERMERGPEMKRIELVPNKTRRRRPRWLQLTLAVMLGFGLGVGQGVALAGVVMPPPIPAVGADVGTSPLATSKADRKAARRAARRPPASAPAHRYPPRLPARPRSRTPPTRSVSRQALLSRPHPLLGWRRFLRRCQLIRRTKRRSRTTTGPSRTGRTASSRCRMRTSPSHHRLLTRVQSVRIVRPPKGARPPQSGSTVPLPASQSPTRAAGTRRDGQHH